MNRSVLFFVSIILSFNSALCSNQLDSLLNAIDNALENASNFNACKQAKISEIKRVASRPRNNLKRRYQINYALFKEYRVYKCDSAAYYLNENILIARELNDIAKLNDCRLDLSYLYSSSGRYEAAIDLLRLIDSKTLSKDQLIKYYSCYDHAYGEMVSYNIGGEQLGPQYESLLKTYKDSLYQSLDKNSDKYFELEENRLRDSGNPHEALKINAARLKHLTPDSIQYALVMFQRALSYIRLNDNTNTDICLALSAISDIKLATKDHASLWTLAQRLYKDGDFERANRYMRFSWDDTNFYNSPLRYFQSSSIQRIIDNQFQNMIVERNRKLTISLIAIAALALLLMAAMFYIIKQKKRLASTHEELKHINNRLNDLNRELSSTNANLKESNCIKEVYISRFIKLCSEYIDKLEKLRATIYKGLSHGKTDDMIKLLRNNSATSREVKILYQNFDTAFLHIFPDFVEQFNNLLKEDERIVLKSNELLNTELRIFALIRLGFTDSSQIAEILRYSVNTIYNYRAKVKNKACGNRADFEELVKNIH